jgi:hypothetical protein
MLRRHIALRTGIGVEYLRKDGRRLDQASVAERLPWAAHHHRTRLKNRAYILFGIFNVAMPILYGEGDKAFARPQEEIIKVTGDVSLLAWGYGIDQAVPGYGGAPKVRCDARPRVLAETPDEFEHCSSWLLQYRTVHPTIPDIPYSGMESTSRDVSARLLTIDLSHSHQQFRTLCSSYASSTELKGLIHGVKRSLCSRSLRILASEARELELLTGQGFQFTGKATPNSQDSASEWPEPDPC